MPRSKKPLIVIIRGPMGAGKSTLLEGLAQDPQFRFWRLDTDAAESHHPSDPYGDHLEAEWRLEDDILALHSKITLGRGMNLVLDPGIFLTSKNVDRFLRKLQRSRREREVVLIRLAVEQEEAVTRKQTVRPDVVRSAHLGWQPRPIPGEVAIVTTGLSAAKVLREAKRAIRARIRAHPPRRTRHP